MRECNEGVLVVVVVDVVVFVVVVVVVVVVIHIKPFFPPNDIISTPSVVRLDRVSNDGYKSCRGLRIYSQAILWNSASCRRRVRALRSLSDLSLSLCPLMQRP